MREGCFPDEELVQRLPMPLAQLYRRAHNAKTALERHNTAFFLWEASLVRPSLGGRGCRTLATRSDIKGAAMNHAMRLSVVLFVVALFGLAAPAGDDKTPTWKPFLPPDDFPDLTKRSLERIRTLAKDDGSANALRGEALILAGYTMSANVKDVASAAGLRRKAIKVATLAAKKETADEARKLAADLAMVKLDAKGKGDAKTKTDPKGGATIDWPAAIGDIADIMTPLASKAKGGEGIHADLQYTTKLKMQNGTEALLIALSAKQLTAANAKKMARELEIVGYRVATIGALTRRRGPHKNKEDAKVWDEQSVIMRDSGIDLAVAAEKKDAASIFAASRKLVGTCVLCHDAFK